MVPFLVKNGHDLLQRFMTIYINMIRAIILLISESESWTPGKKIICTLWIFFFAISDVKTAFTSQDVTQNNIYIIYVLEPEHLVTFQGAKLLLYYCLKAKGEIELNLVWRTKKFYHNVDPDKINYV